MSKNPVGRPTKYRPEYCEAVVEFGRQGMTLAEMACNLDVMRSTLYEWEGEHPEFSDALKRAREYSLAWWEAAGRKGLPMGSDFNAALYKVCMSGRFPNETYRTQHVELTGSGGGPIQTIDTTNLSDDQLRVLASIGNAADNG